MKPPSRHTIHRGHQHTSWDNSIEPAIRIASGVIVEFRDIDLTCEQVTPATTAPELLTLDFNRLNPVSGPVYVEGAKPGDALKVTLLSFEPKGWGWTGIVPGYGLLDTDFPEPAIHLWKYDSSFNVPAMYGDWARVPLKPFCGTIGLAQAAPGAHSTIPPYACGGNMDIRDLTIGTEVYFPVEVAGGLFSIGDPHAAQGDGEVCGTAIESPMSVVAKIELIKDERLRFPRFVTHGPVTRHIDAKGYSVTTGIGPDLMRASQDAVRGMIDLLAREQHMSASAAYMLCSVCADLRISEIVDRPNWVVSCYLPRQVFE